MKRLIIILTLVGLLLQNFSKLFILAGFEMNRDYIAANLCVKKAEPKNCCQGSCHLKKQLDSDQTKQEGPSRQKLKSGEDAQICQSFVSLLFNRPVPEKKSAARPYYFNLPEAPVSSVFRPPLG